MRAGCQSRLVALVLTMIVVAHPAVAVTPSADALSHTACTLLSIAGAPAALAGDSGRDATAFPIPPNACTDVACWNHEQGMDGLTKCVYSRRASLTLDLNPTAKAARSAVKAALAMGYTRMKVRAKLAASIAVGHGLTVVMAVGKTTAALELDAASELDDSSPSWAGIETELIKEAKTIAGRLRRRGCAEDSTRCFATH